MQRRAEAAASCPTYHHDAAACRGGRQLPTGPTFLTTHFPPTIPPPTPTNISVANGAVAGFANSTQERAPRAGCSRACSRAHLLGPSRFWKRSGRTSRPFSSFHYLMLACIRHPNHPGHVETSHMPPPFTCKPRSQRHGILLRKKHRNRSGQYRLVRLTTHEPCHNPPTADPRPQTALYTVGVCLGFAPPRDDLTSKHGTSSSRNGYSRSHVTYDIRGVDARGDPALGRNTLLSP